LVIAFAIAAFSYYERAPGQLGNERSETPSDGFYRVVRVKDGDTVVVEPANGGKRITCRLYGIDAPETPKQHQSGQPYGGEAKEALQELVMGRQLEVIFTGDTTYGRQVCRLEVEGVDVNREMVRRGMAWAYLQYLKRPHASSYMTAEEEARKVKRGLWREGNPTPPWEFRHRQRRETRL
jgi:endonuclease YncB( thermonuclease family)